MSSTPQRKIGLGVACRLGAVVVFGAMLVFVKLVSEQGVHTFQIIFFRNAFAFVPIVLAISLGSGFGSLRTRKPAAHFVRSAIGVAGMCCGFTAIGMLPVNEFTTINFTTPLMIAALSGPILGERVGAHTWAAVALGFTGVLIAVRPDPANMADMGVLLAFGQAAGAAGAMLAIRQLGATESGPAIAFYFTVAATLLGAVTMPFVWRSPDALTLFYLVMIGLCGGVGQLLLTQAFKFAPAAVVAPFDYAALLWNGALAYLIWRETPAHWTVIGGAIVVGSGLYLIWRQRREAQARRRQGSA